MGFFDNTSTYGLTGLWDDIKENFNEIVDYVCENPGKVAITAVAGVATGGVAWAAAPAIASVIGAAGVLGAASTGTTISTLSGAALTNASLAALGGGAVSAGGLGMAGGTAVVTAVGGVVGTGAAGAAVVTVDKLSD